MYKILVSIFLVLTLLILVACNDDEDTTVIQTGSGNKTVVEDTSQLYPKGIGKVVGEGYMANGTIYYPVLTQLGGKMVVEGYWEDTGMEISVGDCVKLHWIMLKIVGKVSCSLIGW